MFGSLEELWKLGGALDGDAGTLDGTRLAGWRAGWWWLGLAGRLAGYRDSLSCGKAARGG